MTLLRTDGRAFRLHKTAKRWKLSDMATPGYYREHRVSADSSVATEPVREREIRMLENVFKQHEVPLWGIVDLARAIQGADGYRCIAFCLPYDRAAVAALPDDDLMNRCTKHLGDRTKAVYQAIARECSESRFVPYKDVDRELKLREKGVSQKVLAHLAGLGWIGRSSLLVTPGFGPRVRLGTLFTREALECTEPRCSGDCGDCTACVEICPAGAISRYAYDVDKCRQIVTNAEGQYKTFCGLCMQVCPQGNAACRAQPTRLEPHR